MDIRAMGDVSSLPETTFGHGAPQWWGLVGMVAIEGTLFALCVASYFYLRLQVEAWPPHPFPFPDLSFGIAGMCLILAGAVLMRVIEKHALALHEAPVMIGLFLFIVLCSVLLAVRANEFAAFHVKWDSNAYGSIVWLTLIFHSLHILTTLFEKMALLAYVAVFRLDEKRALDIQLNRVYWDFVAGSWLILYPILYFGPRVLN